MLSIYYNYTKYGNKMAVDKLIDLGIVEIICELFFLQKMNNPNTSIMCIGLMNKIIKFELNSDSISNKKLNRTLIENSVLERFEAFYLNGQDPVMSKLIKQGIEYLREYFNLLNKMEY